MTEEKNDRAQLAFKPTLSIGEMVSVGMQIYRSNLKSYLGLSVFAHLWLFVPMYGWAKYFELAGQIAGRSFAVLARQPEIDQEIDQGWKRKRWRLLRMNLIAVALAFVSVFLFSIVLSIIVLILIVVVAIAMVAVQANQAAMRTAGMYLAIPITIALLLLIPLAIAWSNGRFFIADLPIVTTEKTTARQSLRRSWQLTKRFGWRLSGAVSLTYFIGLPGAIVVQMLGLAIVYQVARLTPNMDENYERWSDISFWVVCVLISVLTLPMWASVKAVVYYELSRRKEGFGLTLRS